MGFRVQIEADYKSEILRNIHPEGKPSGGKAVFAFLMGLWNYSLWLEKPADESDDLAYVMHWFGDVELITDTRFLPTCQALLDCMWGDGGDSTEYYEDEYAFYVHRTKSLPTEAQFKEMVRDYRNHWKPIDQVRQGVQLLLRMFSNPAIGSLEGFFFAQHTIPDFEALEANLHLLQVRGNKEVRLNFS